MGFEPSEDLYKEKLNEKLNLVYLDNMGGQPFRFQDLFYLFTIDEGQVAFRSYAAQMEFAQQMQKESFVPGQGKSLMDQNKAQANQISQGLKGKQPKRNLQEETDSDSTPSADQMEKIKRKQSPPAEGGAVCAVKELSAVQSAVVRIENENRNLSKQILRLIKSSTEPDEAKVDKEQKTSDYLMEEDGLKSGLIISDDQQQSRILVLASAGHGKTTLLRRIAHFYTCKNTSDPENQLLKNMYQLTGEYLPCLIPVRNIGNRRIVMDDIIKSNLLDGFQVSPDISLLEHTIAACKTKAWAENWIEEQPEKLLLLIDGLDELSDHARLEFLAKLDGYLRRHPQVHVIMSSRVAGLSAIGCKELLGKMKFRGRSLLPLTDDEAKEYAEKWIEVTQPPAEQARQKKSLNQVLTQSRFRHLREFMRTPLELIIILKQLGKDMMSLNRYHIFYDMLWELLTNHVTSHRDKKPVFDDLMTLLGFLAYQMQLKNALFISKTDIESLVEQLNDLNYYTDITKEGTAEDYIACLDNLAANIGIVERADWESEVVYTLPIRAYQEFLVAYACCHLRLSEEQSRPDAYVVITQHLEDSQWLSIINFVLSDLCINKTNEFDRLMTHILEKTTDLERLQAIVEADLNIASAHAQGMFKNILGDHALSAAQKSFLLACMGTKSAYAYTGVLKKAQQKIPDTYALVEANALIKIMAAYNDGASAFNVAMKYLQNVTKADVKIGAAMMLCLAKVYLGEELQDFAEIVDKVKSDLRISDDVAMLLYSNARMFNDVWSINALATLWLTKIDDYQTIERFLGETFGQLVIKQIDDNIPQIKELLAVTKNRAQEPAYGKIRDLFYALGTLRIKCGERSLSSSHIYVMQLLTAMYKSAKDDVTYNQVALAIAGFNYSGDADRFTYAWGHDVCKGMATEFVRKERCKIREQNHFSLVRNQFVAYEQQYRKNTGTEINALDSTSVNGGKMFSFFRAGKLVEAAEFCIANMGKTGTATETNLAFLLRYGKLNPKEIGNGQYDIVSLLREGVAEEDDYALLNMALYELEHERYDEAVQFLEALSESDWVAVSTDFWKPELWETRKDPEGALVCVLAHRYGVCGFSDYDEMLAVVKQNYPEIPAEILTD